MSQYQHDVETGFPYPGASNVQLCDSCASTYAVSYGEETYDQFESDIVAKGWSHVIENGIDFWYCPECCNEKV